MNICGVSYGKIHQLCGCVETSPFKLMVCEDMPQKWHNTNTHGRGA
jgi:hypothetical protein